VGEDLGADAARAVSGDPIPPLHVCAVFLTRPHSVAPTPSPWLISTPPSR
jgi:hypothetical protein